MVIAVLITIPSEKAQELAHELLKQRLCACVNLVPSVESFYWWKGNIESAKETLMIIKTKESLYGRLKVFVEDNHPYDVPEIIALDVDKINPKYLQWLNREADAQPYSQ